MTDPLDDHDKYRTLRTLGSGGMGQVLLAEHRALGSQVVVKLLHDKLKTRKGIVDRLRLEAQALARLQHPNIIRVTDFDVTKTGQPFFVMEYLPGRTLSEEADARGGWIPWRDAIDLMGQVLSGLRAAHDSGLVHRDIKLENLFLCEPSSGTGGASLIKILDFGVAKVVDGAADAPAPLAIPTGTGVVVGTPRFFAPEQARANTLDHRADIYAVGLVLYSLVAGRGPFDEATTVAEMARAHIGRIPDPPSHFSSQAIPARLDRLVLKALEKLPEDRYQTAHEFGVALEELLAAAPEAAPKKGGGTFAMEQVPPPGAWSETVPLQDLVEKGLLPDLPTSEVEPRTHAMPARSTPRPAAGSSLRQGAATKVSPYQQAASPIPTEQPPDGLMPASANQSHDRAGVVPSGVGGPPAPTMRSRLETTSAGEGGGVPVMAVVMIIGGATLLGIIIAIAVSLM